MKTVVISGSAKDQQAAQRWVTHCSDLGYEVLLNPLDDDAICIDEVKAWAELGWLRFYDDPATDVGDRSSS